MTLATVESDVAAGVHDALALLKARGAVCGEVSLSFWRDARAIWNGFAAHAISAMMESGQEGFGRRGFCDLGWQEAFGNALRANGGDLPPAAKLVMATGRYLRREGRSLYFSKATNFAFRRASRGRSSARIIRRSRHPDDADEGIPPPDRPLGRQADHDAQQFYG